MKRKLDANDVPSTEPTAENYTDDNESDFESLNLDPRLRQALIQENFLRPTLVQSKAIPLALEGKDVLGTYIFCSMERHRANGIPSARKDRLRENCRLRPTNTADDSPEESGSLHLRPGK